MMINVFEKLMPVAAKSIGWKGALEIAGLASVGAEGLNLIFDKGGTFLKNKLDGRLENKKQELLKKRAAVLEQKAEEAKKQIETEDVQEVEAEVVEVQPKKASTKKNK